MTITNINKLKEAQRLLSEIYIVDDNGEEHQIKYINFETFSTKQAKKKKVSENTISTTKSIKWGKPFYSMNLCVVIEQEETTKLSLT